MARWRLTAAHYLNLDPSEEYSYEETDRNTGRRNKQVFKVPRPLDPKDPRDCNYDGEVIVGQGSGTMPKDYIFTGPPTPDMLPLDEAAQLLSDRESPKWINPIDGAAKRDDLGDAIRDIAAIAGSSRPGGMVPREEFDELKAQLAEVVAMNKALLSKERRV